MKTWYYLELLTPEGMKLLESTENKITKEKNSENIPHLEINEIVTVHCNIFNNDYQQVSCSNSAICSIIKDSTNKCYLLKNI